MSAPLTAGVIDRDRKRTAGVQLSRGGVGLLGGGGARIDAEAGQDGGCRRAAAGDVADPGGEIAAGQQTVVEVIDEFVDEILLHLVERTQRIRVDARRGHARLLKRLPAAARPVVPYIRPKP